jgi:hemin uptake protein HemP
VTPFPDEDADRETQAPTWEARMVRIADAGIDSRKLFAGRREVIVRHGPEICRPRLTAHNTLVLTK